MAKTVIQGPGAREPAESVEVVHEAPHESVIPFARVSRDPKTHEAALALSKRVGPLDNTEKVYAFLAPRLRQEDQEVFLVLPLDLRCELKTPPYEVARGQRSSTVVGVEDVLRAVLESGCEGFIVAHNHPSGKARPSTADKQLTRQIQQATKPYGKGVMFLDHVVIGTSSCYSIVEKKEYTFKEEVSVGLTEPNPIPTGDPEVLRATAKEFRKAFERAMGPSNPASGFVTHYSVKELQAMKARLLAPDGLAGIAVKDHGDGRVEGTALFNAGGRKGMGERMLRFAIEHEGVNYLECFGEGLRDLYQRNGFVVETESPFNDESAPPGWNYARFGRPNYYTMRKPVDFSKTPKTQEEVDAAIDEMLSDPAGVRAALRKKLIADKPGITKRELDTELAIVEATLGF